MHYTTPRPAAEGTFRNPVHDAYFADPFILRHGEAYYAYGTNTVRDADRAFEVLRSTDLVDWTPLGAVLPVVKGLLSRDHWAPEVAEHEGRFFMYFSAGIEDRGHQLRVAIADRPDGPFRHVPGTLTPDELFAIDGSPFRDEDGKWYLYFARDLLEGDRPGTSIAVDRLVDMTRLAGESVSVLRASGDWQIFKRQREMYGKVYDWHTLEGPFVVKRRGRYWCFYSGGAWTGAGYGVAYAVADSPLGPFVEAATDGPTVLRSRPGVLEGPGHNSVITAPNGDDYIVYHAWDAGHTARRMCIDRLEWTDEGPRTAGPSAAWQPIPGSLVQPEASKRR